MATDKSKTNPFYIIWTLNGTDLVVFFFKNTTKKNVDDQCPQENKRQNYCDRWTTGVPSKNNFRQKLRNVFLWILESP